MVSNDKTTSVAFRIPAVTWVAAALCTIGINTRSALAGTCPAAGRDTDCGILITISPTGATAVTTGQGPYDGNDDTLVGVVNNSNTPIRALGINSGTGVFRFDGDGLTTFGVPGNAKDGTGYGGANAFYSNIVGGNNGVVNFNTPIAPGGGSSYFGLENDLTKAISVRDIVNKAVSVTVSGATISATFTPNLGLTMAQARADSGFANFDWIQKVTQIPDANPFQFRNGTPITSATAPFSDPPAGGGYALGHGGDVTPDNSFPFYYDPKVDLPGHLTASTLTFSDRPANGCLAGGATAGTALCKGLTAPVGAKTAFTTDLAGVLADGSAVDLGVGFTWTSDFNGTAGGTAQTKSYFPIDPNSGTGGVTLTATNDFTNYLDPLQISIVTVNDQAIPDFIASNGTTAVPEPSGLGVFALGLASLAGLRVRPKTGWFDRRA